MRWCVLLVCLAGCDTLFPEFAGNPPASVDGGGDAAPGAHVSGLVCALGDVRDYRSCGSTGATNLHVTVEETRDQAPVDGSGAFTVALSAAPATVTLGVVDPTGAFLPTVTTVPLASGRADGVAVPLLSAATAQQIALGDGSTLDDTRGLALAWAVDAHGAPIAGVTAQVRGASGPFYDGPQAGEVDDQRATGARGLVAVFGAAPPSLTLALAPPAGWRADGYTLPIRGGAMTFSLLVVASATP